MPPAPPPWPRTREPTGPQPELPREKLVIVTRDGVQHEFNVEMALAPEQQITGEMFRTSVPPDGGMLFDWHAAREFDDVDAEHPGAARHGVHQRRRHDPLDRREHRAGEPGRRSPSHGPVRATLELAAGTAARLDIRVGDKVEQRIFGNAPGNPS